MDIDDLLEFLNLYLFTMDLFVIAVLTRYLWFSKRHIIDWWTSASYRLAIGLFASWIGAAWLRGWTWYFRKFEHLSEHLDLQIPVYLIGLIVTTIGLVCVLRQLTSVINDKLWYGLVAASAVMAAVVTWWT